MNGDELEQAECRALPPADLEPSSTPIAVALELLAVFILGLALMTFLFAGPAGVPENDRGLPGFDDFYHVKMSQLMPRMGLVDQFPWLTTTIFADRFVNHHWGFQALMSPFIYAGERLHGDPLVGARWAITVFFATAMVLFHLLLITERVPFRWLWLGMFLVMPAQFFGRHVFIRAIAPSLGCMLAVMILMFRRRYAWCALVIAFYVHIYLGALCYVPLLVGAYFIMGLVGENDEDRVPWKLLLWAGIGLAAGWLTHPYRDGVFDFLKVQVFGSGLTPEIAVGREWKPYEGKLWEVLFEYFGSTLSLLAVAMVARLRMGGRLNVREGTVLAVNFAFLILALRQRRFIEYWPPFGVLASAMLVGPLLHRTASGVRRLFAEGDRRWLLAPSVFVAALAWGTPVVLLRWRGPALDMGPFLAEWRLWALVVGLCALAPLTWIWSNASTTNERTAWRIGGANLASAAALLALAFVPVVVFRADKNLPMRMWVSWTTWIGLAIAYLAAPYLFSPRSRRVSTDGETPPATIGPVAASAIGSLGGAALALLLFLSAGPQLTDLQRSSRCSFDLPAIREAMDYLRSVSAKDAIVFTDDWDVFPVFFYHNHHNRYIVGLDPMFSYSRDPLLYTRYVKITQSKSFPVTADVEVKEPGGPSRKEPITVRLEDIRDYFHAEYVIVDPDHKGLGKHLEKAPDLAERVFPAEPRDKDRWPPYTIYRITKAEE